MNDKPLISVAIPAYKDKYLGAAIESVLNQTVQNIELIIVNDASPNPITEVVEQYSDPRIRYYINEQNIGGADPVANWNRCLSYAQGEFFALLCDDDLYDHTFLQMMLYMAKNRPECNVFKSGVKSIDANHNVIGSYPLSPEWESCEDYIRNVAARKRKQTISEWMFRREHILACGGYESVPMAWGADYLSIMKFSVQGGISACHDNLVSFRRSGENITTIGDKYLERKLIGTKVYTEKLREMFLQNRLMSKDEIGSLTELMRIADQKAALSVASPLKIWSIRHMMKEACIPSSLWLWACVKNIVKKVIR